jgi:hypothetical protein
MGLQVLKNWTWSRTFIPHKEAAKRRNIAPMFNIVCLNEGVDWQKLRRNDTVLITGDGGSLPDDVKTFESWDIPHDLYCVNRSMLYFNRPIDHWGAVDMEESAWFSQYANEVHLAMRPLRHTMGYCAGFDIFWGIEQEWDNEYQKKIWAGNTGYFGVLTSIAMGYRNVVLAGMPLDRQPHWYEPGDTRGPNWVGACYTQWMDFKMQMPNKAEKVRSMSGYSAFILGKAEKDWINKC